MKSRIFCTLGLATLLGSSAWAQLTYPVKANVPFDFAAGDTKFAAGEYRLTTMLPNVLKVEDASRKHSILLITNAASTTAMPAGPALIFHRYGGAYFLAQVWGGEADGIQLRQTAVEKELAKATNPEDTRVVAQNR